MKKLRLVLNEQDTKETITNKLVQLVTNNKQVLSVPNVLDYVECLENIEKEDEYMFSNKELKELVTRLTEIVTN